MRFLEYEDESCLILPAWGGLKETVHVFDRKTVDAINTALASGRPLLVRGEPGTGKSQLARAAAVGLGRAFLSRVISARTEAQDLLWSFDAVARLAEAQIQAALGVRDELTVRENLRASRFLAPGPLWWAFDWTEAVSRAGECGEPIPPTPDRWRPDDGIVILLDEIDKADSSVPNGLLECLGHGRFVCPDGTLVTRGSSLPPLVLVTTNEERALPDAFLRRCMVVHLAWPAEREAFVEELLKRGRAHFPECSRKVLEAAARQVSADREAIAGRGLYPPGGAEYLDLLRALDRLASREAEQIELLERIGGFALGKHPPEQDLR